MSHASPAQVLEPNESDDYYWVRFKNGWFIRYWPASHVAVDMQLQQTILNLIKMPPLAERSTDPELLSLLPSEARLEAVRDRWMAVCTKVSGTSLIEVVGLHGLKIAVGVVSQLAKCILRMHAQHMFHGSVQTNDIVYEHETQRIQLLNWSRSASSAQMEEHEKKAKHPRFEFAHHAYQRPFEIETRYDIFNLLLVLVDIVAVHNGCDKRKLPSKRYYERRYDGREIMMAWFMKEKLSGDPALDKTLQNIVAYRCYDVEFITEALQNEI